VKAVADRVAVLDQGRLVEQGRTFEIFAHPQHPATRAFVGTVTGATLPEGLRTRLSDSPVPGGQAVIRVTFTGANANEPVLSRIARLTARDVNILSGQVESIGGHPFGTLIVSVPADTASLAAVQGALARLELKAEVLGYVS
jgi:D-methionine transport system ATP-binding protein